MKSGGIIVISLVILALIVGGYFYFSSSNNPSGTNNPAGNQSQQTLNVEINGFAFSPATLNVKVGDTVKWTNMDSVMHTVTSDSGTELASGQLTAGTGTYSHTFSTAGTYTYHCSNHPSMKAKIIVA